MPRKDSFPGTIYAQKGRNKWIIKMPGHKPVHTGLEATPENKKIARQIREKMYLEMQGIGKKEKAPDTSIQAAFEDFLATYCATLTQASLEQYVYAFRAVLIETESLTVQNVEASILAYLKKAAQRKLSQTTVNNYLSRVQTFLTWCEKRYKFPKTDFASRYYKPVSIVVEIYTEAECAQILAYCQASTSNSVQEVGTMIGFMLETGARLTDCLNLTPEAVRQGHIAFRNKVTKETEMLPITEQARTLLAKLPKREKRIFRWQPISASRLHRHLREILAACEIPQKRRSFQEFRTTFRNRLLDAGVQPEITMKLMRHKDIRTTMKHYTKISDEALENALKKVSFGSDKVASK